MSAIVLVVFLLSLCTVCFRNGLELRPVLADFFVVPGKNLLSSLDYKPLKSFLGGIIKGIGSVVGAVGSVAKVIPGVGTAIAAGANAVSSILKGGSVKTTAPGQASTQIGYSPAPVQETFIDKVLKPGPLGLPVVAWLGIVAAGGFLLWRKLRRR
jgi:hypothetical protein